MTLLAGHLRSTSPFDILDDPAEWSGFSKPLTSQPGQWESSLQVDGMVCAACAINVEQVLQTLPGVHSAEVSAGLRHARVVWSATQTMPSTLFKAIARAGYTPLPANDRVARSQRQRESRLALWRWLVAALCMMQVMMYAYPAYVAAPGDLQADQAQMLRWAAWMLTLPVIAFSCVPFFKAAWRDARRARIGMDTPVALALVITFVASTLGTFDPEGAFGAEVYFDSLTMFVFFLLSSRWLEMRLRDQTAGSLEALMNRLPDSVLRRIEGDASNAPAATAPGGDGFERVSARRLRVGDVIRVLPGEAFVADGTILAGETHVNESLLTGETDPLRKRLGQPVVAGSYNLSGVVTVQVTHIGASTRFAQIVDLIRVASTTKPHLAALADRVAAPFLWLVLLAAGAAVAFWWGEDPQRALMAGVAVLIVTCPCALSLATPAAMMAASGALARRGVLVRNPQALEALAQVDTVVFDKTGTLTQEGLTVGQIRTRAGSHPHQALAMASALAQQSLHPAARAVATCAAQSNLGAWQFMATQVGEVPGQGVTGRVTDLHAGRAVQLRLGSAHYCQAGAAVLTAFEASPDAMRYAHVSDEQGWLAAFELVERLRPDALQTVTALRALCGQVCALSGDSARSVARLARQLEMTSAQGDCSPDDKLAQVQKLRDSGHRVLMVGDGLNDGPALAAADVSIAMGKAVPLAQSAADFVIQGDALDGIAQAVVLARKTVRIVRQNLLWAALYNFACIPLAMAGWLPAWVAGLGMATSSLLVVGNAMRLARVAPTRKVGPVSHPGQVALAPSPNY